MDAGNGMSPGLAREIRMAEVDAVVDDRDDDRWIAVSDPKGLESVYVNVGDARRR